VFSQKYDLLDSQLISYNNFVAVVFAQVVRYCSGGWRLPSNSCIGKSSLRPHKRQEALMEGEKGGEGVPLRKTSRNILRTKVRRQLEDRDKKKRLKE
jgi:hypothetical protein